MTEVSPAILCQLLRYEPEAGKLYWLPRVPALFHATANRSSEHQCNNWNSQFSGRQAFTYLSPDGYLQGAIFRRLYKAHRVIWAMQTGEWPTGLIDHINGIRSDNRIANLRDVCAVENARNFGISSANTSGCTGVFWSKQAGKWQARFKVGNKQRHVGYFDDIETAAAAIKPARIAAGFHENHGRGGL